MQNRLSTIGALVFISVVSLGYPNSLSAQQTSLSVQDKALFDWAEYAYPRFFYPAGPETRIVQGYFTRYYGGANTYLGVKDQTVFATGAPFSKFPDLGGGVRQLGTYAAFTASMNDDGFGVRSGEKLLVSEAVSRDASGKADWFELFNAGSQPVSLAGYQVKDDGADHPLRSLPNVTLQPGAYYTVTASEVPVAGATAQVAFNLGDSDSVRLYKQGVMMDELSWDNSESEYGFSFGHYPGPLSKPRSIIPTPGSANKADAGWTRNMLGSVGTLKSNVVHTIAVTLDQTAFVAMVEKYRSTRTKDWIEGTVTIDGVLYKQVGLRLKGNSSLQSVTTSSDPATVPWLIKLDKYVKTQNHEGMEEFVVRSNNSRTALNEAVALELLELAGLATQDSIEARFSINGAAERLRLIVESPDGEWMAEEFASTGALYKAEASGDYSYRGDDPASYTDIFDQEAGSDNADLTPLIGFLKFINQADDATFNAELPKRFNIDTFASYMAMQDLLNNFDDIDGPGNNSYLYYDTISSSFTIVPWDYNLAFGIGLGGGGGGANGGFNGGGANGGGGFQPGAGGVAPTRPVGGGGVAPPNVGGGGFGGPNGRTNILVTRFKANSEWNALYLQKLATLRTKLYGSGIGSALLGLWADIASESGLVDAATVASEKAAITTYVGN